MDTRIFSHILISRGHVQGEVGPMEDGYMKFGFEATVRLSIPMWDREQEKATVQVGGIAGQDAERTKVRVAGMAKAAEIAEWLDELVEQGWSVEGAGYQVRERLIAEGTEFTGTWGEQPAVEQPTFEKAGSLRDGEKEWEVEA